MPPEYTSAESNIVSPASRQMSTSRVASATSLAPQDVKNSLPPPNVPVPRLNAGTLNPEPPSCLYSIAHSSVEFLSGEYPVRLRTAGFRERDCMSIGRARKTGVH